MKAKNSMNAVTHGVYAREVVLPWEDPQAFAALHTEIRNELNPNGLLEEEAVLEVAELHWRKQRLALGFLLQYYKRPPSAELIAAAKGGLNALALHLASQKNRSPNTWVATGSQMLSYIKARGSGGPDVPPACALQEPVTPARGVVEQAYQPDAVERHLKTEAAIDNRIAKVMGRLVGLKEYKKMYTTVPVTTLPRVESPPLSSPDPHPAAAPAKRKWGDP